MLEWLGARAAGGYLEYEPDTGRFALPPEQAAALADEQSPFFMLGGFECRLARTRPSPLRGDGARLPPELPRAARGRVDSGARRRRGALQEGGVVADVGCGHGASTILVAQAYPQSVFVGIDYHDGSIAAARESAAEAGVAERVHFQPGPRATTGCPLRAVDLHDPCVAVAPAVDPQCR